MFCRECSWSLPAGVSLWIHLLILAPACGHFLLSVQGKTKYLLSNSRGFHWVTVCNLEPGYAGDCHTQTFTQVPKHCPVLLRPVAAPLRPALHLQTRWSTCMFGMRHFALEPGWRFQSFVVTRWKNSHTEEQNSCAVLFFFSDVVFFSPLPHGRKFQAPPGDRPHWFSTGIIKQMWMGGRVVFEMSSLTQSSAFSLYCVFFFIFYFSFFLARRFYSHDHIWQTSNNWTLPSFIIIAPWPSMRNSNTFNELVES